MRAGIAVWLLSWVPLPALLGLDGNARIAMWIVQWIVGLIGLAIAGRSFAAIVKHVGWRHAPKVTWDALVHGRVPDVVS